MNTEFEPKLVTVFKEGYTAKLFGEDHFYWDIKTCVAFAKKIIEADQ